MILDPKDGTPIKEEELEKSAVKLEGGVAPAIGNKKGLFPCETCGKVSCSVMFIVGAIMLCCWVVRLKFCEFILGLQL